MTHLIAVAGHTGSGKSTAVEYLKTLCGGEIVYLGSAVLDYMNMAQISITPQNELYWRLKLREQDGPAAFAKMKAATIISSLASGVPVLVDAIFAPDEFKLLKSRADGYPTYLIGITASFETRCN
jgi:dephospho-CoA kinase